MRTSRCIPNPCTIVCYQTYFADNVVGKVNITILPLAQESLFIHLAISCHQQIKSFNNIWQAFFVIFFISLLVSLPSLPLFFPTKACKATEKAKRKIHLTSLAAAGHVRQKKLTSNKAGCPGNIMYPLEMLVWSNHFLEWGEGGGQGTVWLERGKANGLLGKQVVPTTQNGSDRALAQHVWHLQNLVHCTLSYYAMVQKLMCPCYVPNISAFPWSLPPWNQAVFFWQSQGLFPVVGGSKMELQTPACNKTLALSGSHLFINLSSLYNAFN